MAADAVMRSGLVVYRGLGGKHKKRLDSMGHAAGGRFPFFTAEFLSDGADVDERERGEAAKGARSRTSMGGILQRLELDNIDAHSLDHGDAGPVTEVRARKEKLAACSKQASRIAAGLFVGGDVAAKDVNILQASEISHVVNCVGQLYDSYHEDVGIRYLTLYLNDSPKEDILAVLFDAFSFIDEARSNGGNVFVHCSQGVSRSMSLAIAYRMWKETKSYEEVFADAKTLRSVANPNIGFVFQLMQWWKRRRDSSSANLYRIAPQSVMNPKYLVPRWVNSGLEAKRGVEPSLDPRGAFVLHKGDTAYIWRGSELVSEAFIDAAKRFVTLLERYERDGDGDGGRTPIEVVEVTEGDEDDESYRAFLSLVETCLPSATKTARCPTFDADFDIWADAHAQNASDSSRSRKTPRRSSCGDAADSGAAGEGRRTKRAA